jgi:hypothetical protein
MMGKRLMSEALSEDNMVDHNEVNNEPLNDGCLLPLLNEDDKLERRPTLTPRIQIPVTRAEMELWAAEREQLLQGEADAAYREYCMHRRIFSPRHPTSPFLPQSTLPPVYVPPVPKGSDTFSPTYPTSHFLPQVALPTVFVPIVPKGSDNFSPTHPTSHVLPQVALPTVFVPIVPKGSDTFSPRHPTSHFLPQAVPTVPTGSDSTLYGQYCFFEQTGMPVINHRQDFLIAGENHNTHLFDEEPESIFEMEL